MTADVELDEMERQLNERFRVQAIARHRRVQSWREARPVVARIRQVRPSDELAEKASAWWQITITGADDGWLFQRHRTAVWMGDMLAREQLARRDWDTEESPNA